MALMVILDRCFGSLIPNTLVKNCSLLAANLENTAEIFPYAFYHHISRSMTGTVILCLQTSCLISKTFSFENHIHLLLHLTLIQEFSIL